ncbi:MAG: hypothetical protein DMG77_12560 [Acidobacteria bacterium]|nr:MAG: hypothetical protein DMG77_12560 [Acidobacteriota bacterium]
MTSKLLRILLASTVFFAITALAQTGSAAAPPGSSPTPTSPAASVPATGATTGTRVGTINIEGAIFGTNEGRRDFEALQKKLEPKQNELKSQNDELEALKKQLSTQGDKLNEEALGNLRKQIETKQKSFDRSVQDAQEEAGNQQNDIAQRILQKMAPMIMKYAQDNGFGMIVDTTKPWPQSPILWSDVEKVDITKPVVDAYNAQSGVPAPASTGTAPKPSTTKPTGTATPKPSTSTPAKPAPPPTQPPK